MKTETDWNQKILKITMTIEEHFPELSKHLKEMPRSSLGKIDSKLDGQNLEAYYNSLVEIVDQYAKTHLPESPKNEPILSEFLGYPLYPPSSDIYSKGTKEMNLDPNDITKNKTVNEKPGERNEKDFEDDMSGDDLDVPGSELDDKQERKGSEDEENNYYSLGGENHKN